MKKNIKWVLGISFIMFFITKYTFKFPVSQSPTFPTSPSHFSIHYISAHMTDVALILCEKKAILINSGSSLDEKTILAYLSFLNIETLDAVIYSDHISQNNLPTDIIYAPSLSASNSADFFRISNGTSVSFGCLRLNFFKESSSNRINTVLHHINSEYKIPASSALSTNDSPSVMLIRSDTTGLQSEIRHFKLNELLS